MSTLFALLTTFDTLGWLPSFFLLPNELLPWEKRISSRLSTPRYHGLPLHRKWLCRLRVDKSPGPWYFYILRGTYAQRLSIRDRLCAPDMCPSDIHSADSSFQLSRHEIWLDLDLGRWVLVSRPRRRLFGRLEEIYEELIGV